MNVMVSVIIPVYNRERVIKRAIDSVLAQTFNNFTVIIIDDGSTDNTETVVKSIQDKRIQYVKSPNNLGPSGARNLGIELAAGEYIAFLDSDDEWFPRKLEKQVSLMMSLSDDWGVCHTGALLVKDGLHRSILKPDKRLSGSVYKKFILSKINYVTPSLLCRKSCINRIGMFDINLWQSEDTDLLIRALKAHKLAVITEPLVVIHVDTIRVMDINKVITAQGLLLKKHEHNIRILGWYALHRFRSLRFWKVTDTLLRAGYIKLGLTYLLRALIEYPFAIPVNGIKAILASIGLLKIMKRIRFKILGSNDTITKWN